MATQNGDMLDTSKGGEPTDFERELAEIKEPTDFERAIKELHHLLCAAPSSSERETILEELGRCDVGDVVEKQKVSKIVSSETSEYVAVLSSEREKILEEVGCCDVRDVFEKQKVSENVAVTSGSSERVKIP